MHRRQKIRWIASYPKSGNTWVRLFLNAYEYGALDINKMSITIGDHKAWYYQSAASVNLAELTPDDALHYRNAALMNAMLTEKIQPVTMKTHHRQDVVNGVTLIPPELTHSALYLVRDPRQVAVSYAAHNGRSIANTIGVMADEEMVIAPAPKPGVGVVPIVHYCGTWSRHVESWTAGTQVPTLFLKYEDMAEDPAESFKMILELFSVPFDAKRFKLALRLTRIERLQEQEQDRGFVECPPGTGEKFFGGRKHWRDVLTKEQVRRIEFDHGETMKKFGYLLENENGSICEDSRVWKPSVVGST